MTIRIRRVGMVVAAAAGLAFAAPALAEGEAGRSPGAGGAQQHGLEQGTGAMPGQGAAQGMSPQDQQLEAQVRQKLQGERELSQVDVEARNGTLTLEGQVDRPELRERAEELVQDVEGVREVQNEIRVAREGGQGM